MYSFDVFDTLLTRITATPQGIFALMRDRLQAEKDKYGLDDYISDNFFELRIHSEQLMRNASRRQNVEEINLKDIYTAMAVCGCLNEDQIDFLCRLEQETELSYIVGIPENIRRLKELLAQGERVVLISDMYLSQAFVRRLLLQTDDIFKDIPLYVSSEYGVRKTTSNLYRLVGKLEQVNYEDWIHIGDNVFQDIEIPYSLGIRVELSSGKKLNPFENKLLEKYGDDSRLQLMIGTAARIEQNQTMRDDAVSENAGYIGYRYAGPVLYSYGEWIVEQAIKKNIKRLYFIARDGYLVKRIVDVILAARKIEIQTNYIYGSRKAWRIPALSEDNYNLYQLVFWSHVNRIDTLSELADIMHIPLSELYPYLPGTYAKNKGDDHIWNQELQYIVEKLSGSKDFIRYHLQCLEPEKTIVQQYLAQEIDTSDDYFAFVDVSGSGLTQGCLWQLMKERYPKAIHTFFFRIERVNLMEGSVTDTFMPGFLENKLIIEMMCRAPHGQTRGYTLSAGRLEPVLEEAEKEPLIAHGFYEYEKGILDFSQYMVESEEIYGRTVSSMRNVLLYLEHIAKEPSENLLEFFGTMPSSESGRVSEMIEYAPRLTEQDIKEIFLGRTNELLEKFYKGTNLNYSIMRATEKEKALIEQCKKEYDSAMGKLYRQEKERAQRQMRGLYGRAAFYPVRMLEERIILYGAGKFGQDLWRRLQEDSEHEIILWVDKMASACHEKGLTGVREVSELNRFAEEQIVIAVMSEGIAEEIRNELEKMGVDGDRIFWIQPYSYPNPRVKWKTEKIG